VNRAAQFALAAVLDLVGAVGALLIATRTWQVVRIHQPAPLPDDVLRLTGRAVDAAPTALALVALAGLVAVLATRGLARRVVGVVLAAAGAGLVWRAMSAASAVSAARAGALEHADHPGISAGGTRAPTVLTNGSWPALTIACGVLVLLAGVLVATCGHRWSAMSARYENQPATEAAATDDGATARAAASMWNALDRGDDPTAAGGAGPKPRSGEDSG
jgi:uncharacterized membrane protein (TIGR02234 family)